MTQVSVAPELPAFPLFLERMSAPSQIQTKPMSRDNILQVL